MRHSSGPDAVPRRSSRRSLGRIVLRGFLFGILGGFIVTLLYLIFR